MSGETYKRISYDIFNFLIRLTYLGNGFVTVPMIYTESIKHHRILRVEKVLLKLCELKFLDKKSLTKEDFLKLPETQNHNLKYKYILTKRAERFIEKFESELHVFQYYQVSDRAMNILYYLLDVNKGVTFVDMKEEFLSKIKTCGTEVSIKSMHNNYAHLLNMLVKDKMVSAKVNADDQRVFTITEKGRNVLDLSNKVSGFLKDEDYVGSTIRNIKTKFKTLLMFPLWT